MKHRTKRSVVALITILAIVFTLCSQAIVLATEADSNVSKAISIQNPVITEIAVGSGAFNKNTLNDQSVYITLETTDDEFEREYEVLWGTTSNPTTMVEISDIENRSFSNGEICSIINIDMELTSGTTYYFKVRRCQGNIKSEWSNVYSYTHKIISAPSIRNVSLSFQPVTNYNGNIVCHNPVLNVSWNNIVDATGYVVEVQREYNNGYSQCFYKTDSGTSCKISSDRGLAPGEKLRVYVKATDSYKSYSKASDMYEVIVPTTLINSISLSTTTNNRTEECKTLTLEKGENTYIDTSIAPYDAVNQSVNWTSSNPEVATVSSYGNVTAISEGKTTLTCYAIYGDAYRTCEVIVISDKDTTEPEDTEADNGIIISKKCGDNATWTLDKTGLLKITGTGAVWNRNAYSVASSQLKDIKRVEISEGITELGEFTFTDCVNLTEIVLPESLEIIKLNAFENCAITNITIPKNVAHIEYNSFIGCKSLEQINVVPENKHYFSVDGILIESTSLTLVAYPTGKDSREYTIFNGIEHIGSYAFGHNEHVELVILPDTVKTINLGAFAECKKLKNVIMSDNITYIGRSAFYDSGLTSVRLPSRLEVISSSAFGMCKDLDYIVMPKSVVDIGDGAFYKCLNISHINYEGTADEWDSIAIDNNNEPITTVDINFSSTHVHSGGISTCKQKAVCSICGREYGAYDHSIEYIPYKSATCVESGWDSYEKCSKCDYSTYNERPILNHTIGKYGAVNPNCESEGNTCYYKCSYCDKYFSDSKGINEITKEDTVVAALGHDYKSGKCTRCNNVEANKCGDNLTWSIDENGVLTIEGSGEMWEYYSWTPSEIKEVIINDGATSIGSKAFYDCRELTKISIPESVTIIGEKAFANTSLIEIIIPNSVTSIGKNAFYNCSNLVKMTIPFVGGSRTNETILGYLFSSGTYSYKDPSSGAILYKTIYYIPSTLKEVVVTDAVSIESQAFKDCSYIETIVLPNTLTTINSYAFVDCSRLSDVYYEGTQSEWDSIFYGTISFELHILGTEISSIALNKNSLFIYEGEKEPLTVIISPEAGTNKNVTWSSSDDDIVSVENGVITGVSIGTATITATSTNGKSASCTVTVGKKVTHVFLNKTTITLNVGVTESLFATTIPADATNKEVVWSSSDENVASVSSGGVVTANAAGTATITATTVDGNKTAECTVVVEPVSVTGISLNETESELTIGDTLELIATIIPEYATNKEVVWSSSDEKIASVSSDGVVTANAAGTATIIATTVDGNKTAECTVVVEPVSVTGISLNETSSELIIGDSLTLTATITPEDATNKEVVWSSSDENIASVSEDGVVTANDVGTAIITVTTVDSAKRAECTVTVDPILVTGVLLNETESEVFIGDTLTLIATVTPADATNKNVVWRSSDENVASVSFDGVVTAKAVGTAIITVTTVDGNKVAECAVIVDIPDEEAVEAALEKVVKGTVEVLEGVSQADKTAAVQAYVEDLLEEADVIVDEVTVAYKSKTTYIVTIKVGKAEDTKSLSMKFTELKNPDVQAVEDALDEVVKGTVEVLQGASQADKTAAVQAYVEGLLDEADVEVDEVTVSFKSKTTYIVTIKVGKAEDSKNITITFKELKNPDVQAVEDALDEVVKGTVEVLQGASQADKTAAVQTYVEGLLDEADVSVDEVTVTFKSKTTYIVTIKVGKAEDSKNITITFKELKNPDVQAVEDALDEVVKGTVEVLQGASQADKTAAVQAYVEGLLDEADVEVDEVTVSFKSKTTYIVTIKVGKAEDSKNITITFKELKNPDVQAVEDALDEVVKGTVEVLQGASQADKTAAVQAYVEGLLDEADVAVDEVTVTFKSKTTYIVTIKVGKAEDSKNITITFKELKNPDVQAVEDALDEVVKGTVEVLQGASQADKTAAVQTYVEGLLDEADVAVDEVTVTFKSKTTYIVTIKVGKAEDSKNITITFKELKNPDVQAVEDALDEVVKGTVEVLQGASQADKTAAVQAYVEDLLDEADVAVDEVTVTFKSKTTYIVTIKVGKAEDSKNITITFKELKNPDVQAVEDALDEVVKGTVEVLQGASQEDKTAAVQAYVEDLLDEADVAVDEVTVTFKSKTTYIVTIKVGKAEDSKSISMKFETLKDPDTQAVEDALDEVVKGTVEVPQGADKDEKLAAVEAYVEDLLEDFDVDEITVKLKSKTTYTVTVRVGNAEDSKNISVTFKELKDPDTQAVEDALDEIVKGTVKVSKGADKDEKLEAVQAYVEELLYEADMEVDEVAVKLKSSTTYTVTVRVGDAEDSKNIKITFKTTD